MTILPETDPVPVAVTGAIRSGDLEALRALLIANPDLAAAAIGDEREARSLLHIATDWPGQFPHVAQTIALLVQSGANPNARFIGGHTETPLHWAASANDVAAIDALIDAGAEIDAPGAVIAGGTPITDAVAFAQWDAARRLADHGARMRLAEAAALGYTDTVAGACAGDLSQDDAGLAFWYACHGGQIDEAALLLAKGANLNWIPKWERLTPLDAARRNGFSDCEAWLESQGAGPAAR